MTDALLFVLTLVALLGCALMSGAFFAFSSFVMKALVRLPAPQGIAGMQSINVAVINPWFLTPFLGTAAICLLLVLSSLWRPGPMSGWSIAGGLSYVAGTFGVTVAFNIPRNQRLAALDPASPDAPRLWAGYVAGWTAWNHVRTVAALCATAALALALSG